MRLGRLTGQDVVLAPEGLDSGDIARDGPGARRKVRPAVTVATLSTDVSPRAVWCSQKPDRSHEFNLSDSH